MKSFRKSVESLRKSMKSSRKSEKSLRRSVVHGALSLSKPVVSPLA